MARSPTFRGMASLARALRVWWGGLPLFLVLGAIPYAPLLAARIPDGPTRIDDALDQVPISAILDPLLAGAVVACTAARVQGGRARLIDHVSAGVGGYLSTLFPALLLLFMAAVARLPALLVATLLWTDRFVLPVVASGVAAALLAAWIVCSVWVAVPAAVLERRGGHRALKRSEALTSGHRAQVLVQFAALLAFDRAVAYALGAAGLANTAIGLATHVVVRTLQCVALAVAYFDLRAVRDLEDVRELARRFE